MRRIKLSGGSAPSLMLTPLLDMFTIILIFLLVSLDSDMAEFKKGVADLPESQARGQFVPAVNVDVTQSGIFVDPVPGVDDRTATGDAIAWVEAVSLSAGVADARYHAEGIVPELVTVFEAHYAERRLRNEKKLQESDGEPVTLEEPILLVQADKTIRYDTLYLVLQSAAQAGFGKYRLATVQGR